MKRFIALSILCLLGGIISTSALAIGLGDIQMMSRLNQRFEAHIPVLVSVEVDADDLTVKLASQDQYKRAGISRGANVLALQFEPKRLEAGEMVIKVTTRKPIREPILKFIVEVEHQGSRSMREFTTFLEAPSY